MYSVSYTHLFRHRQQLVGIYLGALKNRNGALEWQGTFSSDDIQGKGIRFGQTEGVWIQRPGGKEYVAEWDDYPVDISRFVIYPKGGEKCIRCPVSYTHLNHGSGNLCTVYLCYGAGCCTSSFKCSVLRWCIWWFYSGRSGRYSWNTGIRTDRAGR